MADKEKTEEVAKTTPAQPKKRSVKKLVGIIVGAIVAVFVIIFIVASVATSGASKAANEFLADIQAGNASAAYSLFTSEAQDATSQSEFKDAVDRVSPILTGKPDMQSKQVNGETGSAATATVVYKVQGTDKMYLVTVNLQKENDQWKVLGFESTAQ